MQQLHPVIVQMLPQYLCLQSLYGITPLLASAHHEKQPIIHCRRKTELVLWTPAQDSSQDAISSASRAARIDYVDRLA